MLTVARPGPGVRYERPEACAPHTDGSGGCGSPNAASAADMAP
jgi:hypothetical protein